MLLTQQHIGLKYASMEMPSEKTHTKNWLVLLNAYYVQPIPHSNAEMKRVFGQTNVVKLKLNNRMSGKLVNAILNIRTGLKRDNIIKHVMIMTEIPEAVTM